MPEIPVGSLEGGTGQAHAEFHRGHNANALCGLFGPSGPPSLPLSLSTRCLHRHHLLKSFMYLFFIGMEFM